MKNEINLAELLDSEHFHQLRSMNLINEIVLRNLFIREEYEALRVNNSASVCIAILMDKYHLSDSSINSILFRKGSTGL